MVHKETPFYSLFGPFPSQVLVEHDIASRIKNRSYRRIASLQRSQVDGLSSGFRRCSGRSGHIEAIRKGEKTGYKQS